MLIWLEDAPVYGHDSDDVTSFIDEIITCKKTDNDPELEQLVNRQIHRLSADLIFHNHLWSQQEFCTLLIMICLKLT